MTDKLTAYNKACIHIEERRLGSLTEACERRRVFDALWDDVVAYCLGQGLWRFAKRVIQIDASSTVAPAFGYIDAFKIPDDWVSTVVISAAPNLDPPLMEYNEEAGYWYANATPLYVSYISSDPLYGLNLGAWPASFSEYVELRLAQQACGRISSKETLADRLQQKEDKARRNAKGRDAMNDPPGRPPLSLLARSRLGNGGRGGFGRG